MNHRAFVSRKLITNKVITEIDSPNCWSNASKSALKSIWIKVAIPNNNNNSSRVVLWLNIWPEREREREREGVRVP